MSKSRAEVVAGELDHTEDSIRYMQETIKRYSAYAEIDGQNPGSLQSVLSQIRSSMERARKPHLVVHRHQTVTPEDMQPGAVIRSKSGEELIVKGRIFEFWVFLNSTVLVQKCNLDLFTLVLPASEASARAVAHAVQTDAKPPHPGVIPKAPEPETCSACNRPFGPYRIRMERTPFLDWCGDCTAIDATPAPEMPPEQPSRLSRAAQWHLDHTSVVATPDWEV